jgi:hypothetical protein
MVCLGALGINAHRLIQIPGEWLISIRLGFEGTVDANLGCELPATYKTLLYEAVLQKSLLVKIQIAAKSFFRKIKRNQGNYHYTAAHIVETFYHVAVVKA